MTPFRRGFIGLALLMTVAACGGSDDDVSPAATTTTSGDEAATTTTEAAFTGAGSEQFCAQAQEAETRLTAMAQAAPSPEATREVFVSAADSLSALADGAPDEIKGDVALIAGAYQDLVRELESMGWQGSQVARTIAGRLTRPDVKTASERLGAYQEKVCGKAPPTTGAPG